MLTLDELQGRATITVEDAASLFAGMSRSSAYEAVARGDIPTVRLGRRLFVPVPPLLRMLGVTQDSKPITEKHRSHPATAAQTQEASR